LTKLYRGGTQVDLAGYPRSKGLSYRILQRQRVFFCSPFYQGLCKILPLDRVELFSPEGEKLLVSTVPPEPGED
jgi:hypothetical protein